MDEIQTAVAIGKLVQAQRQLRGWTRLKLSAASGVNSDVIMKIELGQRLARIETLLHFAKAFKVALRELIPE